MAWTILIDGNSYKYTKIKFERKLNLSSIPEFSATVEYDSNIGFFKPVLIKNGDAVEFKGYIEGIELFWSPSGKYANITGRSNAVLLWKKYIEDFSNMHEGTKGFFGKVNAIELIKFMLRTPKSDSVTDYPENKEGWGIAPTLLSAEAQRTSYGDAENVILRKRGIGWRNSGNPYETAELNVIDPVVSCDWNTHGSSPYLHTNSESDYIDSVGKPLDTSAIFRFENLTSNAKALQSVSLTVVWKAGSTLNIWFKSKTKIYISVDGGSSWNYAGEFGGRNTGWMTNTWNLSNLITEVSHLQNDNCRIKFVVASTEVENYIRFAKLDIVYVSGGDQKTTDWFVVKFPKQLVTAVYIESRMDDDSYPRNYKIVTVTGWEDFTNYTEEDPNSHILIDNSVEPAKIDWDSYQNETAYVVKDYGVNGIDDFDYKVGFKLDDADLDPHNHSFCPILVGTHLEDMKTMHDTNEHYYISFDICVDVADKGEPENKIYFRATVKDVSGTSTSIQSYTIEKNKEYRVRVVRCDDKVSFYVYDELDNLIWSVEKSVDAGQKFRYRYHAITWNGDWSRRIFYHEFDNTIDNWDGTGGDLSYTFDNTIKKSGSHSVKIENTSTSSKYRYFREELFWGETPNPLKVKFWFRVSDPPSESVNVDLAVDAWNFVHQDWTHQNTEPWLHNDDENDLIRESAESSNEGHYDEYWTFENLNSKYEAIDVTDARIYLKGRLYDGTGGHADSISIKVYVWDGSQWWDMGNRSFTQTTWEDLSYISYGGNDLKDILDTVEKINNARLKIEFVHVTNGGSDKGGIEITYARLHIEGTARWGRIGLFRAVDHSNGSHPSTNIIGGLRLQVSESNTKWNLYAYGTTPSWSQGSWVIDSNTWICVKVEVKSGSGTGYVKVYDENDTLKIEKTGIDNASCGSPDSFELEADFSNSATGTVWLDFVEVWKKPTRVKGEVYNITDEETELVSTVSNNTFRDIIHSWEPQEISNIKIKITAPAPHSWAISQIYVYKAEDENYRVYHPSASYPAIKAFSSSIQKYEIGPLNVKRSRLIDAIDFIVSHMHENYVPYEWWLLFDDNNTFKLEKQKGSDKHLSIQFEVGKQLQSTNITKTIDDSAQRIRVVGRAEGKRQEKISSDWKTDAVGISQAGTFIEDIISEKSIADKTEADLLAQIYLKQKASPQREIVCKVQNDTFSPMSYDVGDIIYLRDTIHNYENEARIYNLKKTISRSGLTIVMSLDSQSKDLRDSLKDLYDRLKALEITPATSNDWADEGVEAEKIDTEQLTSIFSATASNDEFDTSAGKDDPKWVYSGHSAYGCKWEKSENVIAIYGPDSGNQTYYYDVRMKYHRVSASDYLQEELICKMSEEPKMVFTFGAFKKTGDNPFSWREGDTLTIGFDRNGYGYWFKIVKQAGDVLNVYGCWKEPNGSEGSKFIRTIMMHETGDDHKYRFELIIDYQRKWAIFDVYSLNAQYPISCVKTNIDETIEVNPLHIRIEANHDNTSSYRAIGYIYDIKIERKAVG